MSTEQPTCADRIDSEFEGTMETLRALWDTYSSEGPEAYNDDVGASLDEYGLCWDYTPPTGDERGYWTYLLSTGGPADGIRVYGECLDDYRVSIDRIDYFYQDWYDGATLEVTGDDFEFLHQFFQCYFAEVGSFAHARNEALDQ